MMNWLEIRFDSWFGVGGPLLPEPHLLFPLRRVKAFSFPSLGQTKGCRGLGLLRCNGIMLRVLLTKGTEGRGGLGR